MVLEGGWEQKKPLRHRFVTRRKAQKIHTVYHCPEWYEVRVEIREVFTKWEQTAKTSKKGIAAHRLSKGPRNRGHCSTQKWESEKHKSWSMPAEHIKDHVAADGSLLGNTGK